MSEKKERPILFNGAMVCAILEGRKTVTRRALPAGLDPDRLGETMSKAQWQKVNRERPVAFGITYFCPFGQPGDRLWVRETWGDVNLAGAPGIAYRADDDIRDLMAEPSFHDEDGAFNYDDERVKQYHFAVWSEDLLSGAEGRWRPSIHMPRWASRILLEITDVRVERLQGTTEEQAEAEGVRACEHDLDPDGNCYSATELLSILWSSLYGVDSYNANPWVWVVEFKRVEQAHGV